MRNSQSMKSVYVSENTVLQSVGKSRHISLCAELEVVDLHIIIVQIVSDAKKLNYVIHATLQENSHFAVAAVCVMRIAMIMFQPFVRNCKNHPMFVT